MATKVLAPRVSTPSYRLDVLREPPGGSHCEQLLDLCPGYRDAPAAAREMSPHGMLNLKAHSTSSFMNQLCGIPFIGEALTLQCRLKNCEYQPLMQ